VCVPVAFGPLGGSSVLYCGFRCVFVFSHGVVGVCMLYLAWRYLLLCPWLTLSAWWVAVFVFGGSVLVIVVGIGCCWGLVFVLVFGVTRWWVFVSFVWLEVVIGLFGVGHAWVVIC
jgi:hypothetical protein